MQKLQQNGTPSPPSLLAYKSIQPCPKKEYARGLAGRVCGRTCLRTWGLMYLHAITYHKDNFRSLVGMVFLSGGFIFSFLRSFPKQSR